MTQEKAQKIFETELGQQLDVIYSTSDGMAFIRMSEAKNHANGLLEGSEPLENKTILEWFPEYE